MKVIITGATGMVGKGVLLECLDNSDVTSVLILNRTSVGLSHDKLREIIVGDFYDLSAIAKDLKGYDACFFCLGVSAVGMAEEKYYKITHDITLALATMLSEINPDMIFNYVSGTGTDETLKSRQMWARVKGKTENDVLALPFRKALMFRPGLIIPEKGIRSKTPFYNFIYVVLKPLLPLFKKLMPDSITTTTVVGRAMIQSVLNGSDKIHLENKDINQLAGV